MENEQKGNLIVIYGVNNLGKTTQAKMLVENLIIKLSVTAEYLKYPIYNLEPTGPIINNFLKDSNPYELTEREFQLLQILNRTQHEVKIKEKLDNGIWIIAEDYVGTGVAWGMAEGLSKEFLTEMNSHLIKESLGILLEGESVSPQIDENNKHETDIELISKATQAFKEISKDYGWHSINANQTVEEVQAQILDIVKSKVTYLQ